MKQTFVLTFESDAPVMGISIAQVLTSHIPGLSSVETLNEWLETTQQILLPDAWEGEAE